jgi:hypothetical protein
LWEGGHELENIILQILLPEIAIASCIIEGDLDSSLEQIDLPDHIVEEGDDLDAAILVSFELEKSGGGEELLALARQSGGDIDELVVVDPLGLVIGLRDVLLQQVPQILQVFLLQHLTRLIL